jgi:hypothetical protein
MTQRPDMADGSCSMPCFLSSLRRMAKASALCGASPSTPCCACCFGSWHSLLSWLLHYAWPHVTTPVAVAQHVSPFQPHAANSPVCPALPSPGAFPVYFAVAMFMCSRLPLRRLRSAGAADRAASHPTKELLRYLPSRASFWKAAYPEFVSLLLLVP